MHIYVYLIDSFLIQIAVFWIVKLYKFDYTASEVSGKIGIP